MLPFQEVPPEKGRQVLKIIHSYKHATSIFDDFIHYEKRQEEDEGRKPTGNKVLVAVVRVQESDPGTFRLHPRDVIDPGLRRVSRRGGRRGRERGEITITGGGRGTSLGRAGSSRTETTAENTAGMRGGGRRRVREGVEEILARNNLFLHFAIFTV